MPSTVTRELERFRRVDVIRMRLAKDADDLFQLLEAMYWAIVRVPFSLS